VGLTGLASNLLLASLLAGLGCQGQVGDTALGGTPSGSGGQKATPGGGATGGAGGSVPGATGGRVGTGGAVALDCSSPKAGAARLRQLSSTQYDNTVFDLFGVGGSPGSALGDAVFGNLDDTKVEQRATVAAAVASKAVANLATWAPCLPTAAGNATCEQQIIAKVGARLYRRPLSAAEVTELATVFDAGVKEKDFNTGVTWFLTAVLQSPDFLYQIVRPDPAEKPGEVRPLAPYEYATRLAAFIWDSSPDEKVMMAATTPDFTDPAKLQPLLTSMIQDARASRGVERFYRRWLNIQGFGELARDAKGFDEKVVTSLATSLLMGATQLYASPSPNIASLFVGEGYYMNDVLRTFYGMSAPAGGSDFSLVSMPNETRRGILTHPALMALLARPGEDNPISRGLFLLRNVLCYAVPPPPSTLVIPPLPPIQDGLSTRQRLDQHAQSAVCGSCHSAIDPAGYAFGSFDEVGRYRTSDHGVPLETDGKLDLKIPTIDGAFASGDDLLARIASSDAVKTCFAEKYLDFALAREVTDSVDACSIKSLGEAFKASGDLKQLVARVASSDSFRMRLAEGVQP